MAFHHLDDLQKAEKYPIRWSLYWFLYLQISTSVPVILVQTAVHAQTHARSTLVLVLQGGQAHSVQWVSYKDASPDIHHVGQSEADDCSHPPPMAHRVHVTAVIIQSSLTDCPIWRFGWKFKYHFLIIVVIDDWSISSKLKWVSFDPTNDKSTLVQVMAWCRQATSITWAIGGKLHIISDNVKSC